MSRFKCRGGDFRFFLSARLRFPRLFLLSGCDWNFQVGSSTIDENAGESRARRPYTAEDCFPSRATRAGSSKLMKLKFAESFLLTEITEMPIDPGEDFTLPRGGCEAGSGSSASAGKGQRGVTSCRGNRFSPLQRHYPPEFVI